MSPTGQQELVGLLLEKETNFWAAESEASARHSWQQIVRSRICGQTAAVRLFRFVPAWN